LPKIGSIKFGRVVDYASSNGKDRVFRITLFKPYSVFFAPRFIEMTAAFGRS
jgi:hypothetical protein